MYQFLAAKRIVCDSLEPGWLPHPEVRGILWLDTWNDRSSWRKCRYATKTSLKAVLLVALLASFSTVSLAELPPYVYKERQQQAPESLIIKVVSVRVNSTDEPQGKRMDVNVEAKVEQVNRTKTGLNAGDVIRIGYVHSQHKVPLAGPSEVPILRQGHVYPAYLMREEKTKQYAPAAGGYSFTEMK